LGVAYGSVSWNNRRIDRLTHDLVATEREIKAATAKYRKHAPRFAAGGEKITVGPQAA